MRLVALVALVVSGGVHTAAAKPNPFPYLDRMAAVKDVTATSTLPDKQDGYAAWRALAYKVRPGDDMGEVILWSAWCEGKKDEGLGETITLALAEPTQIDHVRIAAGVWRTDKLFAANNQITALEVGADGKTQTVKPPLAREWVEAKIGAKVKTLTFKIASVKKGKMNDSCIAGIDLVAPGNERIVPMVTVDPKAVAELPGAVKEIQAALDAPDRKGLEPLLAFPFSNLDIETFSGGGGKATTSASFAAVVAACKTARKAKQDAYVDPKGCPKSAPHDPDDDRPARIRVVSPTTIEIRFQSRSEVGVSWRLVWKERWRLPSIGYDGWP